jgi:hypothetical protein
VYDKATRTREQTLLTYLQELNIMKKSLTMMAIAGMLAGNVPTPAGLTRDKLTSMTPHSRGKSGKSSTNRTGAASLKRAAKKRNNIRKRK